MPKQARHKTRYPGVWYIEGTASDGSVDRIFYVGYRKAGKWIEEKAGRESEGTNAKGASAIRADRMRGKEPTNAERRAGVAQQKQEAEAEANRWTFDRLLAAYQEEKGDYARRVTDETLYRKHLTRVIGDDEPADLEPFKVDGLRIRLLKTHKPATVASILGFMLRLSSYAVRKKRVGGIPFHVEIPREGGIRTESMTEEQMTDYLAAASAHHNAVVGGFLAFELLTGMRAGEVRKLEWSAVDLDKGIVHIRNPKGGRDQFIPVNVAALDLLRSLPRDPGNPFVFQGERGGQVGYMTVYKAGSLLAKAVGLPETFRPNHGLRHAFASHLASSGEVDLYKLQRLLTHKTPSMTQRYAHLTDDALRRGSEVMGRIGTESKRREKAG